ncbi:MAG: FUSC family protein, partial [Blautia sp.]|nr:FUSC family protein [Blautia sp.]
MKRRKPIPLPGQRIFRSALAVAVCLLIYVLRGHQGIPLYSALAAMQCMQPYTKDSRGVGKKRILGTIIGAFWGLLMLLLELHFWEVEEELHYILIPLMLVLVLYSTVLLKVPETAFLSGTVF